MLNDVRRGDLQSRFGPHHRSRGRLLLAAFLVSAVALIGVGRPAAAQSAAPDSASATPQLLADSGSVAAASETPMPASENVQAAEQRYVSEIRSGFTEENKRYSTTRVMLGWIVTLYGIVVSLILLFTRVSARIRDFAYARSKGRYGRALIYFVLYTVLTTVIGFPLAWYSGFALEHQYQLSNQTFGSWFGDELKGLAVGLVFFGVIPIVMLAYLAIERSPRRWWMWLALGSVPLIIFAVLIQPIAIDPLFNKFTPLKDQQLKAEILDLAAKAGIPSRNVYQVDKSAQTKKYNAYVNGFGASQRIVLWDTTLQGMSKDEILFVMGHEMGHYRLGHIWKGIGFFCALSVGLFFLSGMLMDWAVRRFGPRWGFTELHDLASIPLFAIALSLVGLIAQPLANAYSRTIEHEADTFGLEVTHSNDAGARAFIKLGNQNKSNPEPAKVLEWMEYSHPPLIDRVRYAIRYRPWEEGKPNQKFEPAQ